MSIKRASTVSTGSSVGVPKLTYETLDPQKVRFNEFKPEGDVATAQSMGSYISYADKTIADKNTVTFAVDFPVYVSFTPVRAGTVVNGKPAKYASLTDKSATLKFYTSVEHQEKMNVLISKIRDIEEMAKAHCHDYYHGKYKAYLEKSKKMKEYDDDYKVAKQWNSSTVEGKQKDDASDEKYSDSFGAKCSFEGGAGKNYLRLFNKVGNTPIVLNAYNASTVLAKGTRFAKSLFTISTVYYAAKKFGMRIRIDQAQVEYRKDVDKDTPMFECDPDESEVNDEECIQSETVECSGTGTTVSPIKIDIESSEEDEDAEEEDVTTHSTVPVPVPAPVPVPTATAVVSAPEQSVKRAPRKKTVV